MEVCLPPIEEQRRIVARIEELAVNINHASQIRRESEKEAAGLIVTSRNLFFAELATDLSPVRLDSVADSRLGKMLSGNRALDGRGTPYIRNANVKWDSWDLSTIFHMDVTEAEKEALALEPGDILVCEGGDIGKCAIWENQIPNCIYQKALHRLRVNRGRVLPRFMLHHLFWAAEQGYFADLKTQTTIAHLTGVKLNAYGVLIPRLERQRRIVAYLDDLTCKMDSLKKLQSETAVELDALLPSILSKAFRGEL